MSAAFPPDPFVHYLPMDQVRPQAIDWLVPGRLALGKLAILEGDPGMGKSLLALDLCARVSTGRSFPDGSPGLTPGKAVVLDGEDDFEKTTIPRLKAAGAALERVIHLKPEVNALGEPLQFPAHLDTLEDVLMKTQARLLIISPLGAFLDATVIGVGDQGVRRALAPLARLAERQRCALKLVRHLNKKDSTQAVYRGGGSIGFIAACRSAWLVAADPEQPSRRVLAEVKNNLAPLQPSLAFEIRGHESGQPVISWLGPSPWRANQLVASVGLHRPRPHDLARELLTAFLADCPKTSREIWQLALQRGLAERTIRRARKELGLRSLRVGVKGKQVCYWLLPGQQLPPSVVADAGEVDLEPWLAPLRAAYPPSTPLDDL